MAEIQVTSSELRRKAGELRQLNSSFSTAVDNLKSIESTLRSQFEGEASDAFHEAFQKDTDQMMNNFYKEIDKYVTALETIAQKYETAEQTNVGTAQSRTYH